MKQLSIKNNDNLIYSQIKEILTTARAKAYSAVNFAMVEAYWFIGKQIVEAQAGNERAEYGTQLLKYLSEQLTRDFGKGFTVTNLTYMRQFYATFPIRHALRDKLGWTTRPLTLFCAPTRAMRLSTTRLPKTTSKFSLPNICSTCRQKKNCGQKLKLRKECFICNGRRKEGKMNRNMLALFWIVNRIIATIGEDRELAEKAVKMVEREE
jgi:hypothetical protein